MSSTGRWLACRACRLPTRGVVSTSGHGLSRSGRIATEGSGWRAVAPLWHRRIAGGSSLGLGIVRGLRAYTTGLETPSPTGPPLPPVEPDVTTYPRKKKTATLRKPALARDGPLRSRSRQQNAFLGDLNLVGSGQATSFTTAKVYSLAAIRRALPSARPLSDDVLYLPEWGHRDQSGEWTLPFGEIFIFNTGNFVVWGPSDEGSGRAFLNTVIRQVDGVEKGALLSEEISTEKVDYVVADNQETRMREDLIILGSEHNKAFFSTEDKVGLDDPLFSRLAISHALAQSSNLEVIENQLEDFLEATAQVPERLSRDGKLKMKHREVVQKIGRLLEIRGRLNLDNTNGFLDLDDIYWESPEHERLYKSMCNAFDIRARISVVNQKISYALEVQSTIREVMNNEKSHYLEWIIIWLIAFEVGLALLREGHTSFKETKSD